MYHQLHDPAFLAVASGGTPALDLFFSATKALDSRITFSRGSSGTFINSSGLVESAASGVARFTHDPVTLASLGLLIEESRTNLLQRSEEFSNVYWTTQNASVTADASSDPAGTTAADKLTETATTAFHRIYALVSVTSGTAYTFSVFVKAAERGFVQLNLNTQFTKYANFDLSTGTVGTSTATTATATQFPGGWWRLAITATASATGIGEINVCIVQSNTAASFQSYAGTAGSGLFLWGAQVEAGAFATSYIPTTSATVTRAADVATMTGTNFSSWYRQDEGTLVASFLSTGTTGSKFVQISALDGVANNSGIGFVDGSTRAANVFIASFNIQASFSTSLPTSQQSVAIAYKANDFAASFGGGAVSTDTSGSLPTPTVLYIGNGPVTGQQAAGTISRIRYYRRRLPNANLQTLTT